MKLLDDLNNLIQNYSNTVGNITITPKVIELPHPGIILQPNIPLPLPVNDPVVTSLIQNNIVQKQIGHHQIWFDVHTLTIHNPQFQQSIEGIAKVQILNELDENLPQSDFNLELLGARILSPHNSMTDTITNLTPTVSDICKQKASQQHFCATVVIQIFSHYTKGDVILKSQSTGQMVTSFDINSTTYPQSIYSAILYGYLSNHEISYQHITNGYIFQFEYALYSNQYIPLFQSLSSTTTTSIQSMKSFLMNISTTGLSHHTTRYEKKVRITDVISCMALLCPILDTTTMALHAKQQEFLNNLITANETLPPHQRCTIKLVNVQVEGTAENFKDKNVHMTKKSKYLPDCTYSVKDEEYYNNMVIASKNDTSSSTFSYSSPNTTYKFTNSIGYQYLDENCSKHYLTTATKYGRDFSRLLFCDQLFLSPNSDYMSFRLTTWKDIHETIVPATSHHYNIQTYDEYNLFHDSNPTGSRDPFFQGISLYGYNFQTIHDQLISLLKHKDNLYAAAAGGGGGEAVIGGKDSYPLHDITSSSSSSSSSQIGSRLPFTTTNNYTNSNATSSSPREAFDINSLLTPHKRKHAELTPTPTTSTPLPGILNTNNNNNTNTKNGNSNSSSNINVHTPYIGVADDDSDDDIQFIGFSSPILSHTRDQCPMHIFQTQDTMAHKNIYYCDKCYCYVCDTLVSECKYWSIHCQASPKSKYITIWKEMKKIKQLYSKLHSTSTTTTTTTTMTEMNSKNLIETAAPLPQNPSKCNVSLSIIGMTSMEIYRFLEHSRQDEDCSQYAMSFAMITLWPSDSDIGMVGIKCAIDNLRIMPSEEYCLHILQTWSKMNELNIYIPSQTRCMSNMIYILKEKFSKEFKQGFIYLLEYIYNPCIYEIHNLLDDMIQYYEYDETVVQTLCNKLILYGMKPNAEIAMDKLIAHFNRIGRKVIRKNVSNYHAYRQFIATFTKWNLDRIQKNPIKIMTCFTNTTVFDIMYHQLNDCYDIMLIILQSETISEDQITAISNHFNTEYQIFQKESTNDSTTTIYIPEIKNYKYRETYRMISNEEIELWIKRSKNIGQFLYMKMFIQKSKNGIPMDTIITSFSDTTAALQSIANLYENIDYSQENNLQIMIHFTEQLETLELFNLISIVSVLTQIQSKLPSSINNNINKLVRKMVTGLCYITVFPKYLHHGYQIFYYTIKNTNANNALNLKYETQYLSSLQIMFDYMGLTVDNVMTNINNKNTDITLITDIMFHEMNSSQLYITDDECIEVTSNSSNISHISNIISQEKTRTLTNEAKAHRRELAQLYYKKIKSLSDEQLKSIYKESNHITEVYYFTIYTSIYQEMNPNLSLYTFHLLLLHECIIRAKSEFDKVPVPLTTSFKYTLPPNQYIVSEVSDFLQSEERTKTIYEDQKPGIKISRDRAQRIQASIPLPLKDLLSIEATGTGKSAHVIIKKLYANDAHRIYSRVKSVYTDFCNRYDAIVNLYKINRDRSKNELKKATESVVNNSSTSFTAIKATSSNGSSSSSSSSTIGNHHTTSNILNTMQSVTSTIQSNGTKPAMATQSKSITSLQPNNTYTSGFGYGHSQQNSTGTMQSPTILNRSTPTPTSSNTTTSSTTNTIEKHQFGMASTWDNVTTIPGSSKSGSASVAANTAIPNNTPNSTPINPNGIKIPSNNITNSSTNTANVSKSFSPFSNIQTGFGSSNVTNAIPTTTTNTTTTNSPLITSSTNINNSTSTNTKSVSNQNIINFGMNPSIPSHTLSNTTSATTMTSTASVVNTPSISTCNTASISNLPINSSISMLSDTSPRPVPTIHSTSNMSNNQATNMSPNRISTDHIHVQGRLQATSSMNNISQSSTNSPIRTQSSNTVISSNNSLLNKSPIVNRPSRLTRDSTSPITLSTDIHVPPVATSTPISTQNRIMNTTTSALSDDDNLNTEDITPNYFTSSTSEFFS